MCNCCLKSVPQSDSSFEAFAQPVRDWQERLTAGLNRTIKASDHTLGHIEEEIASKTRDLERIVAQEVAQKKADQSPPVCPKCQGKLTRVTHGHERTIQTRFGPVTIQRLRGWCRRCKQWCYPADGALGIAEGGTASPSVQEMAALVGSKMPIAEASAVIERLTGVKLPRATLGREAGRQGERAQRVRDQMDEQISTGGMNYPAKATPEEPFTLVIEIDAWNIRERDDWGQTGRKIAAGDKPQRWHWVYGGTCFCLSDRIRKGDRAMILSRGTVMTRGGIEALRSQLWAEAMRHGLGRAARVLVIADGAIWIWNLVADRFSQAIQRLDLFHAKEHLWTVAQTLYPEEPELAQAWIKPLLKNLERDQANKVVKTLDELLQGLPGAAHEAVEKEKNYFESNLERLKYKDGISRGEPSGSGAMESTCRQYQCRFKRPGQFWSQTGDEALMTLETFWRNDRWHILFPHATSTDPSRN
jgi:hypothetical protein